MSSIEDIIARSRTPGTFVERRSFTLSRDKGLEKLREFTRHPRQYILELIQAAVFSGATYIAVDINHERLLVAWVGGRSYSAGELESIFDYVFADRGEMSTRHLTQLAIGLNALLQRKPQLIRIESGDGLPGNTARMDLDRKGRGSLGVPEEGLAGTYILVENPGGWLRIFSRRPHYPEEGLIETRCLYVPVPVLLNGRAPFGYRASREIHLYGIRNQRSFAEKGRRGVLGLPSTDRARDARREFRMVVGGVWISSLELDELGGPPQSDGTPGPVAGVICDDRLRKTADQSDVVQDNRFVEMLHAVQPVASVLIRDNHGHDYAPPALPPLTSGEVEDEVQAEPLPASLPQLSPRMDLPLSALSDMGEGAPLFWVPGDATVELQVALDPLRFPWPVLVLSEGQSRTLADAAPELGIARLNTPADADFVRRVLEQRQQLRTLAVPFRAGTDRGRLHLRFHTAGQPPRWGAGGPGDVPVLIAHEGVSLWCGQEPLGLSRVSVVLELEEPPEDIDSLRVELADRILPIAWRLLGEGEVFGEAVPDPEAAPELLCGLLAAETSMHFVEEDGEHRLSVSLPVAWGEQRAELMTAPLCDTREGPLSLEALVALQGSAQTRTLTSAGARPRLEGLEERLGFGHLTVPELDRVPVLAVGRVGARWRVLETSALELPALSHLLWVKPSLAPIPPGAGWRMCPEPLTSLARAVRVDQDDETSWEAGLALLHSRLLQLHEGATWSMLSRTTPHSPARCQRMGERALHQLTWALEAAGAHPLLTTAGGERIAPGALREESGRLRIAPRHGPVTLDPDTVLITFDLLNELKQNGVVPRLRLDDSPDIWRSLQDPDDARWLARQQVRAPGLKGWLGLRMPFDISGGVLVQSLGKLIALSTDAGQAPCHGLLHLSGSASQPTTAQLDLLALARTQLYQRLAETVGLTGARAAAAEQYLSAWATERSPIRDAQHHQPLGLLQERLRAALSSGEVFVELIDNLKPSFRGLLRVVPDVGRGTLIIHLNTDHPLSQRALQKPRSEAAELVLMEAARCVCVRAAEQGISLDLLIHRVLIAQRVGRFTARPVATAATAPPPLSRIRER